MPKYTKPLPLDEYDKLTLKEKTSYISDMVDLPRLAGAPPAPARPNPRHHKTKTRKHA